MTDTKLKVLEAVAGLPPMPETIVMELSDPVPWDMVAGLDTSEGDQILSELQDELLVEGERRLGDGSICWWAKLQATVLGLMTLGEWPLQGAEHTAGQWDNGYWGEVAKPLLREYADAPPRSRFVFRPVMGEPEKKHIEWRAAQLLLRAGLIRGSGGGGGEGIPDVALTEAGRRALEGRPMDALDRATVELRRGAKAEALVAATEEAMGSCLKALSKQHGIATVNDKKRDVALATLGEQLAAKGVISSDVRAEISAYLQLRNKAVHGEAATVEADRIARAIEGIRGLCGGPLAS